MGNFFYFFMRVVHYLYKRISRKIEKFYYQREGERRVAEFKAPLRINARTHLTSNTYLGTNTNFNGLTIVGRGKVVIGDNFHSGIDCRIIAQNHNHRSEEFIPYDKSYVVKGITIGDNVWLGDRVTIVDGVTIGEGAIIQAGSVVVSDIPACAIAGGHPARQFSWRDKELYYRLKSEGKVL